VTTLWHDRGVTWVFTLLTIVLLGLVIAVAVGRIGGGLDAPASSLPSRGLPAGAVGSADLAQVRFSPALRGYRMDEVDAVLDRLGVQLDAQQQRIVELESGLGADLAAGLVPGADLTAPISRRALREAVAQRDGEATWPESQR